MGNRGNVIFTAGERVSPCVYLHWNGGPESVYRFLDELDVREVRCDADYEAARFVQVVGEFFMPDQLSLGIVGGPRGGITLESVHGVYTDPSDNGFYVVDRTREPRVVRRFVTGPLESGTYGLRELDAEEVELERKAAYDLGRYDGIGQYFELMRTAYKAIREE